MSDLNETIGNQVQGTADCRRQKAEAISEELRAIGFHSSYSTGEDFLEWHRDLLCDKLHDQIEEAIQRQALMSRWRTIRPLKPPSAPMTRRMRRRWPKPAKNFEAQVCR